MKGIGPRGTPVSLIVPENIFRNVGESPDLPVKATIQYEVLSRFFCYYE